MKICMELENNKASLDKGAGLMARVVNGDATAFEQLYRSLSACVKSYLTKTCGVDDRLNDLTQEVFMRVWAQRHLYSPQAAFKTYLLSYARRVMLEEHDRRRKVRTLHERYLKHAPERPERHHSAEGRTITREIQESLTLAIDRLPLQQREAIWLFYMEQTSLVQGARRVGCTPRAFANRLDRARRRLRLLLQDVDF